MAARWPPLAALCATVFCLATLENRAVIAGSPAAPLDTLATTSSDPIAPYQPRWAAPDGWSTLTAQLDRLHQAAVPRRCRPPVIESGPRGRAPGGQATAGWRIDAKPLVIASAGWRPRRIPAPLFEFRPLEDGETHLRWRLETGFDVALPEGFRLYLRVDVDSDPLLDPTSRTKQYRQIDAAVQSPTASFSYRSGRWQIGLGRNWQRWGPGWTGSLLLDNHHPPRDGWDLVYRGDRWAARYFLQRLDHATVATAEGVTTIFQRYLAAHRIDFAVGQRLRLALTETALIATDGAVPFWALVPILPWALAQQEDRPSIEIANINWGADVIWNVTDAWTIYGQFLLDDYMLDSADRVLHPDRLALLTGITWHGTNGAWRMLAAGMELSHIDTWTYRHRSGIASYQAWGTPLGHPAGPDSDTATGFASWQSHDGAMRLVMWGRWYREGPLGLDSGISDDSPISPPDPSVVDWRQLGIVATLPGPLGSRLDLRGGWTDTATTAPAAALEPSAGTPLPASRWWGAVTVELPLRPISGSL